MKRNLCIGVLSFIAFFAFSLSTGHAQPVSREKKTVILKLMRLTHSTKLADEIKSRVIGALKDSFPDAPADYWKKLEKRIDVRELLNSFVPIYAENLSLDDLKKLVAFYQTPAGQHYLAAREKMVAASMERGKKWAMGWIVQVFKELKAKGYKPKGKKPAGKNNIDNSPNS